MTNNQDVLNEQEASNPKKGKSAKKRVLVTVSILLVSCIVLASFSWIGFLKNNPLAEISLAAYKTFKKSASAEMSITVSQNGEELKHKAFEIAVLNDGDFESTLLGKDGEMLYLNSDYYYHQSSDGSLAIGRLELDIRAMIEDIKKNDIESAVKRINDDVFESDVLNPEETKERILEIAEYYGKRDYLEENLGFSLTKDEDGKRFGFSFGLVEFVSIICAIVSNSEDVFNDSDTYETVVSLLKIASVLDMNTDISFDVILKNGYISKIELDATINGDAEQVISCEMKLFDYKKASLNETVKEEFSKAKNLLSDFMKYEKSSDGSIVFTDKDGKKHKYSGDATTV